MAHGHGRRATEAPCAALLLVGYSTCSFVLTVALHVRVRTSHKFAMQSRRLGSRISNGVVEVYRWLGAKFPGHPQTIHVPYPVISTTTAQRIIETSDPPWSNVGVLGHEAKRPNLTW